MLLKQLKKLTLTSTRRNADAVWLSRFYSSPAVCQSLTTSKTPKRLSRDDRRAVVESFIAEYRAANAGKFPTVSAIHKEVGGSYYVIRDIFQELKLKPKESLPIVAKALSEVSASVPNDASSQTLSDADTDPQSHSSLCNANHSSPVVADPVFQADSPDTIEIGSDHKQATIVSSHPISDESNLQGNNLDITAAHDKTTTETAPNNDAASKSVSSTIVSEECLKNSETEEEENLTLLGSQESKADHPEGAAVSANVLPTENRQVAEEGTGEMKTGEKSGAWSNIMSFAKGFVDFLRKG